MKRAFAIVVFTGLLWRIEPGAVLGTSRYGPKSIPAAIQDVLKNVFDRERAAGQQGFVLDTRLAQQKDGQLPYLLMVANAAGFLFTNTGDPTWRDDARGAVQDYVRYVGAIGPDSYGDPRLRTPASYNSNFFPGTESKIHGWSSRYGQYFLASESLSLLPATPVTSPPARKAVAADAKAVHSLPVPVS
ncbi:MAG: hypothetical protein NT151_07625 [Acidobacteria bacterium]|nr:hypothetical protein [Acidobacteriota bacterium]